jgi:hypothetical protein
MIPPAPSFPERWHWDREVLGDVARWQREVVPVSDTGVTAGFG